MAKTLTGIIGSLEEAAIVAKGLSNFTFFCSLVKLPDTQKGYVPFNLYPYQTALGKLITSNAPSKRLSVLKPRQMGISTLVQAACLFKAMSKPCQNIRVVGIKSTTAKLFLRRVKIMYKALPLFMQMPIVNGGTNSMTIGTSTELIFSNGSTISVMGATPDVGRGDALSMIILDEFAFYRDANEAIASIFPTLATTNGDLISISTPYGTANPFYKYHTEAVAHLNGFTPVKLHHTMHPLYGDEYLEMSIRELGMQKVKQEILCEFLSTGNTVFNMEDIKSFEDLAKELEVEKMPSKTREGFCRYKWGTPDPRMQYFIGADVSTGTSVDYSAYCVMDRLGNEVESFKDKIHPAAFGILLAERGRYWNNALIAAEGNNIGHTTVSKLVELGYPNNYHREVTKINDYGQNEVTTEVGWYTTTGNRALIISELNEDLSTDDNIFIKSPFFLNEAYTFIYNSSGRPVALGKDENSTGGTYTDDSIISTAICNYIRKSVQTFTPFVMARTVKQ